MDAPRVTRYKQVTIIASVMLMAFLAVCLFSSWLKGRATDKLLSEPVKMSLPSAANADLQSLWVQRLETKHKTQTEELQATVKKMEIQAEEFVNLKTDLTNMLLEVKQQLAEKSANPPAVVQNFQESLAQEPFEVNSQAANFNNNFAVTNNAAKPIVGIISHQFNLQGEQKTQRLGEYLPAGSFVKAVVLGGLDAPAGVTAQADPRPALLRLVDLSVLPNKARHDIKDCHVIAAGFGDVSSERAYLRTERLSCTLKNGRIFEQKLKAYVAGEDAKDGLRGNVLRREGDLLFNSFMSGAISGFGKSMSQTLGTTSISPLGATTTLTGKDVLKNGAYGGVGESADSLNKYFIQRAEQMQPVVQISAGREVTIIVLEGVELNVHKTN